MPVINKNRILAHLKELGQIGRIAGTERGVQSLAFSDEDIVTSIRLLAKMEAVGLVVAVDRIGNLIGIRPDREGRVWEDIVLMGSHIDTVATGGQYDGRLGVLGGLEVLESLQEREVATDFPVGVIAYAAEEGARYQPAMVGSRVERGLMPLDEALALVSHQDGTMLGEELQKLFAALSEATAPDNRFGVQLQRDYAQQLRAPGLSLRSFTELHIEQGPYLEEQGVAVAAVQHVLGISQRSVTLIALPGRDPMPTALSLARQIHDIPARLPLEQQEHSRVTIGKINRLTSSPLAPNERLWSFVVQGEAAHAGGSPMRLRRDAGYAAACLAEALQRLPKQYDDLAVALDISLAPDIINVVPEQARLSVRLVGETTTPWEELRGEVQAVVALLEAPDDALRYGRGVRVQWEERGAEEVGVRLFVDLRHVDDDVIEQMDAIVDELLGEVATDGVRIASARKQRIAPVDFDPSLVQITRDAIQQVDVEPAPVATHLAAGHDACNHRYAADNMRAPAHMITIRSIGGISHNPAELSTDDDVAAGVRVMAEVIHRLALTTTALPPAEPAVRAHTQERTLTFSSPYF